MVEAITPDAGGLRRPRENTIVWTLAFLGLSALYLPTYISAWESIWQTDEHGHGLIVLAVLFWLYWNIRRKISESTSKPKKVVGFILILVGALIYIFGRTFNIASLEFFSHLLIIPAVLLLTNGVHGLRAAWFPLLYLLFLIPLPSSLVDAITQPLKAWISTIVVGALSAVGYPIAHSGVIITVGQYQLLVADACSGLHSMYSLAALGTLFMFIAGRKSILHNFIMTSLILPIAFAANIIRVIILILFTYHFGDEFAQGLMHGTAGMVLMLISLTLLFILDSILGVFIRSKL